MGRSRKAVLVRNPSFFAIAVFNLRRAIGFAQFFKSDANMRLQTKGLHDGVEKNAGRGEAGLNESELYKSLGVLTKNRDRWKENIPYVSSLLAHDAVKIQAKALWLLGEIGLVDPVSAQDTVPAIASFCDHPVPLLRARAVNALGRIGRGSYSVIAPWWKGLFRLAADGAAEVRLSFVWASENIAVNTPDLYENHLTVFEKLLYDADDRVRMEAPEIFRVLGKRRPEFVRPFLEQLRQVSETDEHRVVRLHCLGAIKATVSKEAN